MDPQVTLLALLAAGSIAGKGAPAQKSMDAYAKYTGMDLQVNDITKRIQTTAESYIPEATKIYLFSGVYVGKAIIDKKIVFIWHFP